MDDFGGKLRQAREGRGISLRQIAANTKISASALQALERNDVSRLPGGIFSRAFVRSYALEVGLDPDETVREFLERFDVEPPPSAADVVLPEEESSFESRQRMAGVVLKLVVISTIVLGVILYFSLRPSPAPGTGEAPGAETAQAAAHADPPGPAAAEAGAAAPTVPEPPPVPAGTFRLDLHPTGPCWISLTIDGDRVMSRIMTAGERTTHLVRASAAIEVGDAAAFAYSLNGRPGRSLGAPGQVRSARITLATLDGYLR